uniref:Neural cell adhesion molecule L1 n=1 Tax=Scophthalmus maximus TaxID=52904 RepID=A0A8D3C942_SCOMX
MDRNRKWVPGLGAALLILLCHVTSALEVPLDLPQPPTITLQSPKDYIFDPRENIVIHCEAKGKPTPSFSWTRNGTHFDVEKDSNVLTKPGSGTLVIDISGEKAEAYEGTYQCTAHNEHGTAVSNNIVIRQSRSPLWSKERNEAITVQMGVSLVLQCRPPAGLPPPVIFWMDNNFQRLPLDKRVSQALNGDLYFSNVLPEDTRSDYICYARFPHTQTIQQKQPISVIVLNSNPEGERPPGFMMPLGPASAKMVLRGETLELECIAEGLPTPDISWQKDGGELPSSRMSFHNFKKTLMISDVNEADAGDYRCSATNNLGNAHHMIKVTVKGMQIDSGTGILTCRVNGEPKPKITWFVNGIRLESDRKVEDDTVILSNVQTGSSAVYQCNASNEFGYLMANAFVSMNLQPVVVLTPPNQVYQVIANHPALLHCASFGSPIPTITWFKDSQTSIRNGDPYVIHENGTLEIHVAQPLNSGKYTCIATNNLGIRENHVFLEVKGQIWTNHSSGNETDCSTLSLLNPSLHQIKMTLQFKYCAKCPWQFFVETVASSRCNQRRRGELKWLGGPEMPSVLAEKPDPPTDLELTDQTERSVQLTWIPGDDHNSPTERFLIQYEDLLHQPGVWVNLSEVAGTSTTARLSLSPYIYYSFRVLALNRVGYSRPSQPSRQYRTNPAAPDENPSDVKGVGTEPGNLVISWTPLTGFKSNGPGLEYKVLWRQKDTDGEWSSRSVANVSQCVVSGTPTFQPYEIKVQAFNDYGSGPEPEVMIGYSGEDLPLSAPESLQVMVHNSTLAEVHWEPVSIPSVRGKLQGYKVLLDYGFFHVLTFSGNRSEGRLPGLQPYSLYNLFIRVVNSKGEGPQSSSKTFETPEGVPGPPSFLNVTTSSLDSLTLQWGPPMNNNGRLAGYTLKYQPVNNTNELGPVKVMMFLANETTTTLGNLNSSMLYKFYLSAKTIKGSGPIVTEEAFTVIDTGGSRVHILTVKAFNLTLAVRYIQSYNNPPLEFHSSPSTTPFLGKEDWKRELVNGSHSHTIKGLKPGTSYRVRVVARDPSDPAVHSTDEVLVTVPAVPSRQVDIATQGWFIGLMCAIALLILVLLIVCFIKRNKGGKYPVKEKEDAHQDPEIQPMKEDDGTFGEYSDTEDHKPLKGSRTPSNGTVRRDESDDSLVDYGEGGDGQFNEDGSFIGQYSGKKEKDTHEGNESSEAPSPVNAMNSFV